MLLFLESPQPTHGFERQFALPSKCLQSLWERSKVRAKLIDGLQICFSLESWIIHNKYILLAGWWNSTYLCGIPQWWIDANHCTLWEIKWFEFQEYSRKVESQIKRRRALRGSVEFHKILRYGIPQKFTLSNKFSRTFPHFSSVEFHITRKIPNKCVEFHVNVWNSTTQLSGYWLFTL